MVARTLGGTDALSRVRNESRGARYPLPPFSLSWLSLRSLCTTWISTKGSVDWFRRRVPRLLFCRLQRDIVGRSWGIVLRGVWQCADRNRTRVGAADARKVH